MERQSSWRSTLIAVRLLISGWIAANTTPIALRADPRLHAELADHRAGIELIPDGDDVDLRARSPSKAWRAPPALGWASMPTGAWRTTRQPSIVAGVRLWPGVSARAWRRLLQPDAGARLSRVLCGPAGESSLPQCPQGLACNAGTCTALDGTCPIEPDAGPRSVIDGPPSTTDAPSPATATGISFRSASPRRRRARPPSMTARSARTWTAPTAR